MNLATFICLSAYAMGWANAEQVCLNADTIVQVSERYEDSEDALQIARYYMTVTHAGLTIQRMGDLTRNFKGA